ncbi:RGCVC family protein [Amycolatopsis sp. NPDC059021]|uniref:RGCVC family protein n=1 Tax=Amycolatopsis sp. NPDC059021 TaxID=3346704 RepID=UPI00366F672F
MPPNANGSREHTMNTRPSIEDGCPSCPHPESTHDATAKRFCRATAASGLARGCICRTESVTGQPG